MTINTTGFKTEVKRGSLAATNIRILLKNTFPDTKFSVTQRQGCDSIYVSWTDAPSYDIVKELLSPFDIGVSDAYSDYYYTSSTDFSKQFGGVQYLNLNHTVSDEVIALVINKIALTYSDYECRDRERVAVTVENYTNGWQLNRDYHFGNLFNDYLTAHYENRLSRDELKNIAWTRRHEIKNLAESDFIESIAELDGTERMLSEICYYLDWDCGDYYADIETARVTGKEFDTSELLYKISEAKKALRGIPTDKELEAIESQKRQQEYEIEREKILNIKFTAVDIPEGERRVLKVAMPALNKNCTLVENDEEIARKSHVKHYEVMRTITIDNSAWELITQNFLEFCPAWVKDCGHGRIDDKYLESIEEGFKEYYQAWAEHGIATCIELVNSETGEKLYIDTSGYEYARYVGREYVEPFTPVKLDQNAYNGIAKEFYLLQIAEIMNDDVITGIDEFDSNEEWFNDAKRRFFNDYKSKAPSLHTVESVTNDILNKLMANT